MTTEDDEKKMSALVPQTPRRCRAYRLPHASIFGSIWKVLEAKYGRDEKGQKFIFGAVLVKT
jgi:hypothetical protein